MAMKSKIAQHERDARAHEAAAAAAAAAEKAAAEAAVAAAEAEKKEALEVWPHAHRDYRNFAHTLQVKSRCF